MQELTEKQAAVFDYIKIFIKTNDYPPTVRDIGKNFKINTKAVHDHLQAIERKGHIKRIKNISRGIKIMSEVK